MLKDRENLYLIILIAVIIGMILGWLNPKEGPFDYLYDEYSNHPALHRPHRGCPAPAPKQTQVYEDFNEDGEPEWYVITPMFEILGE